MNELLQASDLNLHPELNPRVKLHDFADRQGQEAALCQHILEGLQRAIDNQGAAVLVVSGGRTPRALFQRLSEQPLAWQHVLVTLADERWVPPQHEDANERLVRRYLLQNQAARARFISLVSAAKSAHQGQAEVEQRLSALPPRVTLSILGMGDDGHTASFFPAAQELPQALAPPPGVRCAAVTPPLAPHQRLTLTLPRLLDSEEILLHLCGQAKLPVLQRALEAGAVDAMPVRAVLRQSRTPVGIYWAP